MNRRQIITAACCLTGVGFGANAQAAPPRYYLQQTKHGYSVILRLRDRTKHRPIWQRTFWYARTPTFSQDHRALAAQVRGDDTPVFGLLFWQEGKPPRVLTKQSFFNGDVDGIVDLAWSRDKQRLAILTWAGGGSLDAQNYEIWYMNVPKETFGFSGIGRVRRMKWAGIRQVRYWKAAHTMDPPGPMERVSRVWTCP